VKKIFAFIFCAVAMADTPSIPERSLIRLEWDADANFPARVYTNGVPFAVIGTNQIFIDGPGQSRLFHFYANLIGPVAGIQKITLTVTDTNSVESDFSNVVTQYFRLRAPSRFSAKEK
jgi:hypothetical protein